LLRDWITWQRDQAGTEFAVFQRVIERISPPEFQPPLRMSEPKVVAEDARPVPSLRHPYGEVPIDYASAGITRIVTLAYMLIWTWREHVRLSTLTRRPPQERLIFLLDEVEAHLHPKWQRVIIPALLDTIRIIESRVQVQLFVATHAPLVLASMETDFDNVQDRVFHVDLAETSVQLSELVFSKYGDVDSWLRSPYFGLREPRSLEAERAIEAAKKVQSDRHPTREAIEDAQRQLERALGPHDQFWPRWRHFAVTHGVDD
jgi:hypothetical protein